MTKRAIILPVFIVALVITLALPAWSSTAWAQPQAAIMQSVIDVGVIVRGEAVERSFVIRNDGDQPLELTDVQPTCGCTVVDFDRRIAPGSRGKVVVTLDSKGLRGPVAKSIQVYTNDSRNPQLELVVKANIRAYIEAEPGYARFLTVLGQGADPAPQLIYADEGALAVSSVQSPFPFIEVRYHEATEEERSSAHPGRQWVIEVGLAANAPTGSFADFVEVKVRHPRLKSVRIPVSGFVQPVVAVLPRVADFGRKDLSIPQSATLEVKNLGEPSVTLGAVSSDVAGLTSELEVVKEGRLFRLHLKLDPSMPAGDFRGKLTIETSSRLQPRLEIDVRGTIL